MCVSEPAVASSNLPNAIFSMEVPQTSRFAKTVLPVNTLTQSDLKIQQVATNASITPKEASGRVDVTISWGGSDGVKTDVTVSGSMRDENGNSVEVSGRRDSDGETKVSVSAEHDKDKQ